MAALLFVYKFQISVFARPVFKYSILHRPWCKLPSLVWAQLQSKSNLQHFSLRSEIWWQLATSSMIFQRINWPHSVLISQYLVVDGS